MNPNLEAALRVAVNICGNLIQATMGIMLIVGTLIIVISVIGLIGACIYLATAKACKPLMAISQHKRAYDEEADTRDLRRHQAERGNRLLEGKAAPNTFPSRRGT